MDSLEALYTDGLYNEDDLFEAAYTITLPDEKVA